VAHSDVPSSQSPRAAYQFFRVQALQPEIRYQSRSTPVPHLPGKQNLHQFHQIFKGQHVRLWRIASFRGNAALQLLLA
jgi:hypothetical protein